MLPRIRRLFGSESSPARRDRLRQRFRPQVEALEERLTPNTYTPTTTTDFVIPNAASVNSANGMILSGLGTGQVTLRSAVIAANSNSGADTITFITGVGTTYTLAVPPALTTNPSGVSHKTAHDAVTGGLDVTGALTITGNGIANTIIQAGTTSSNGIDQLFYVNPSFANGFAVSITGVKLQNGKNASNDQLATGDGEGGAIDFDAGGNHAGSLTLSNDVITQNQTINGDGGALALFDGGTVSLSNCTISNNTANSTGSNVVQGGGIFVAFSSPVGTLTLTDSQVTGNKVVAPSAPGSTGGGIDDSFGGLALTIHGGSVSSNQAPGNGGGIDAGSVTIDQNGAGAGTAIVGNSSGGKGGGVFGNSISITSAIIVINTAATGGGGVYVNNGTTSTITGSRLVNNTSTSGASGVDRNANNNATATANGNWWGTNSGPAAFIPMLGGVTAVNWLGLVLTPGAASINANSSTSLNAKIVSTTTSTPNPAGAAVTDTALEGQNVTFAQGSLAGTSVNPTSVSITNGTASSTFFAGSTPGTAQPSVTLDNQTTTTTITVIGQPTANAQSVTTNQDTAKAITLTGSDPNSPPRSLTYTVVTNPAHGTLSGTAPNLTYTPNAGYTGPDSFTFKDNNGSLDSNTATVSISVNGVAQATVSTVAVGWGSQTSGALLTQSDGLRLLPSGRTTDIPWLNVNKINITLSSAATLTPADVSVTGITVANYGPVTISGSGTTYTITLARAISAADRVTVTIGNSSIATYTRRLDVLPGDFLDKGVVDSANMLAVYYATARPYNIFADINGDGVVDINDVMATRSRIGTSLPPP